MAKNLDMIMLLDFYGDMLTEKQRDFISYYYNDDLSLAEIAENVGITRQGVRDAIKRAESLLIEMEERVGFVARFEQIKNGLDKISKKAGKINEENLKCGLSREINNLTVEIQSLCADLADPEI